MHRYRTALLLTAFVVVALLCLGLIYHRAVAEALGDPVPTPSESTTRPIWNRGEPTFGLDGADPIIEEATTVTWQTLQKPSIDGVVQEDSITRVDPPESVTGQPDSEVTRYDLDPSARFLSGGKLTPRVESYGRHAASGSTPATEWPDPVGSIRWYTFSYFVPQDFAFSSGSDWLVLTQWKGFRGGSPPISIEVKRDHLRLGGERTNSGSLPRDGDLGALVPGEWTQLSVGLRLSPDPKEGWVEVIRDGTTVLPRTTVATMDTIDGLTDPVYLKQGIYESSSWKQRHVLYATDVTVSTFQP